VSYTAKGSSPSSSHLVEELSNPSSSLARVLDVLPGTADTQSVGDTGRDLAQRESLQNRAFRLMTKRRLSARRGSVSVAGEHTVTSTVSYPNGKHLVRLTIGLTRCSTYMGEGT
jgi:hypothetical protein